MEFKKNIYCIGAANIDYKLKTLGQLQLATSNPVHAIATFGGVARNVAENLINLTQKVHLQVAVGQDDDGKRLLSYMQAKGCMIETSLIVENQLSSRYYAILDQTGELHLALAAMELYEQIPFADFTHPWQYWTRESLVFFDTCLPAAMLEYAIELGKKNQFMLCIDPVSVAKSRKLPIDLNGVFLIKPDRYEAQALTGISINTPSDCFHAGKVLLERGVKNVIISLGESGYVIVNESMRSHFPAIKLENIVDVSGAGDAFFAGILYGLQQNFDLTKACQMGAVIAALTVQSYQTVLESITLTDILSFSSLSILEEKSYAEIF